MLRRSARLSRPLPVLVAGTSEGGCEPAAPEQQRKRRTSGDAPPPNKKKRATTAERPDVAAAVIDAGSPASAGPPAPHRRKGAARRGDVTPDVLRALNAGTIECATLSELLVVDFAALFSVVATAHGCDSISAGETEALRALGIKGRMERAAELLRARGISHAALSSHASDIVRGWAAHMAVAVAAADPGRGRAPTQARLDALLPFADDANSGVREFAMMAARGAVASDPLAAIAHLVGWTRSPSENVRRFASEATRPRGVWVSHIPELRRAPRLGLPLLEPLRSDPSVYVQKSVGNWLNDASKDDAPWVREVCARWRRECKGSAATEHICRRALRTVSKR